MADDNGPLSPDPSDRLARDVEATLSLTDGAATPPPKADTDDGRVSAALPPRVLVCDAHYGFPTQKRPRKERINAVCRQIVNFEVWFRDRYGGGGRSSPPPFSVVLVGKSDDCDELGKRIDDLRRREGGPSDFGARKEGAGVRLLPGATVEGLMGLASPFDDDAMEAAVAAAEEIETETEIDHTKDREGPSQKTEEDREDYPSAVYLSPDGDITLSPSRPPPRRVVVGMIVDRRVTPGRSKNRAGGLGVPSARLPMSALGKEGSKTEDVEVLNVDSVLELMVRWWEKYDELCVTGVGKDKEEGQEELLRKCFMDAASGAMRTHRVRHPKQPVRVGGGIV